MGDVTQVSDGVGFAEVHADIPKEHAPKPGGVVAFKSDVTQVPDAVGFVGEGLAESMIGR